MPRYAIIQATEADLAGVSALLHVPQPAPANSSGNSNRRPAAAEIDDGCVYRPSVLSQNDTTLMHFFLLSLVLADLHSEHRGTCPLALLNDKWYTESQALLPLRQRRRHPRATPRATPAVTRFKYDDDELFFQMPIWTGRLRASLR